MPVVPGFLERLAFRANLAPSAILDVHGAASLHAVALADELGVLAALDGPQSVSSLAAGLACEEDALRRLLDALVAVGYADRSGDEYWRTRTTERWLTEGGDANLAPFARFWVDVVLPYWREHAARAVREGDPGASLYEWLGDDEAGWATTQAGFRAAASLLVDPVVDALGDYSGARVLDLGGGHGAYAVELARRGASVTLVDRPPALEPAREAAAEAGVDVRFVGGDYLTDDLWRQLVEPDLDSDFDPDTGPDGAGDADAGYDLVLLFNVLHGHSPAEAATLLDRAAAALAPGGKLAILDQFGRGGSSSLADVGVALIDLTYLITFGGGTLDADSVNRWLGDAGLSAVETKTFRRAPGVKLLRVEAPYPDRN
ncbi:methyltransferase [Halobaculum magnesiiphilum]|uniref:Methyltransferase domain-containing protein n=1 Tax=Halobaculum magnesiiphilum TaxID=1017351 RepID=A0A8T8W8K4_9EURY|nr:methyltransferase [Halobaculum magnesiiphilum]QZP36212.1 methyltransferase domain-containing protein [Halobaculum magnesiiphilum]